MNPRHQTLDLRLQSLLVGSVAVLTAVLMLALPVAANAQETTSGIRGYVTAPNGQPAAGVSVTVTDTRTSRRKSTTTSASGRFTFGELAVGGPYTVSMESSAYAEHNITDVVLTLGETFEFSVTLAEASVDEITVTATAMETVQVAVGPSTSFNFDELQNLPTINRDVRDIIRADPRVYVDIADVGSVQCVGANPRFNSLTVDGIKLNDNFGLNRSGFPTQRQPFPYDAIQNVSLELSPYDVQYGGFTACNINAVTRSGSNEFSGRVWLDYTDDSLVGDKLEGDSLPVGDFDETRWGVSFGGPILRDKLFFFAAYEKADGADTYERCAGDQSCGTPVLGVSQAQLDRIATIAQTVYGYNPGTPILSAPNEDEKFLARFDWNINDNHNVAFTYNYNEGFNIVESDGDADEFEFSNHFYSRGAELNSYTAQLFSDWTDNFSTEVRVAYAELDATVKTQNEQDFGEVQIETYFDGDGDGDLDRALVYLGGDDSRQSNNLDYDTTNMKFAGTYTQGDHEISGGFEREEIDIFNLFLQHTIGEYRFDENRTDLNGNSVGCSSNPTWSPSGCIDQFEALSPDDIYYGNAAPSLDPNDAAALFKSAVNTVYLQDEFTLTHLDLTIVAGLRYDWWESDDLPRENSNFVSRAGFTNSKNFDGESLLQPRVGFNWDFSDTLSFRGGVGLYSGGNPNVWLGNNYQNDGFTQVQAREGDGGVQNLNTDPAQDLSTIPLGLSGSGQPIFDAPQSMIQFVAGGSGNTGVNSIDPNFKIPSNWKFSLGGTWAFDTAWIGNDYIFSADVVWSQAEDSAVIVDDTLVQIGTAPDGRPIYFPTDKSIPSCAADPLSDPGGCDRLFNGDYILTNVQGSDAESFSFAGTLSKSYDWGLDWTFGYAYTEADDVSPMTSSVAFSNYFLTANSDSNNPGLSRSNYEIPNRFILRLGYENEFFGDNKTRFSLVGSRNEGRPFSYTFFEQGMFFVGPFFNPDDDRSLLYMPSGPNDPNVVFDPGFDQAAFFEFAESVDLTKHGGSIVPRNSNRGSWWTKVDVRVSQEIPGFSDNQKGTVYFVVENIGNLINDDWGVLYERSFPRTAPIVDASLNASNQYVFNEFISQDQSRSAKASVWKIRFGLNYNFN
ncbi:MAG: TonB-dependent receptor [Gammaproteobacteria bacterium]|nr:TonB-dependent receptor [Gammaproteobacteria bacterium]